MSSSYRMELDRWLKTIDVKCRRVLDIGGSQQSIKGRTRSWDVQECLIVDLPNPHKGDKPDIELDLNIPLSRHKAFSEASDVVFCLEVFEYIWNPAVAMENIANLMGYGAKAYVSFPSVYPLHQPVEHDSLRYMPAGIQKLAQNAGLTIVNMTARKLETNAYQQFVSAERMRAAKNEDHNFSGWMVEFKV